MVFRENLIWLVTAITTVVTTPTHAALLQFDFAGTINSALPGTTIDSGDPFAASFRVNTTSQQFVSGSWTISNQSVNNITASVDSVNADYHGDTRTLNGSNDYFLEVITSRDGEPWNGLGNYGRMIFKYLDVIQNNDLSTVSPNALQSATPYGWVEAQAYAASSLSFTESSVSTIEISFDEVFRNSVDYSVASNGTGMLATFTPNLGLTLEEAADIGGYDHFNWLQIITKDTIFPIYSESLRDMNGDLPSVPYIDAPLGGYAYQIDACNPRFPVRDGLPWYLDESIGPSSPIPGWCGQGGTYLELNESTFGLTFEDWPNALSDIEFLTALVGVNQDGSGEIIGTEGTIFRWLYDGSLLFGGQVTKENFQSFSGEELKLISSISNIRDNLNPNIIDVSTGTVSTIPFQGFTKEETTFINDNNIQIRSTISAPGTILLLTPAVAILLSQRKQQALRKTQLQG